MLTLICTSFWSFGELLVACNYCEFFNILIKYCQINLTETLFDLVLIASVFGTVFASIYMANNKEGLIKISFWVICLVELVMLLLLVYVKYSESISYWSIGTILVITIVITIFNSNGFKDKWTAISTFC